MSFRRRASSGGLESAAWAGAVFAAAAAVYSPAARGGLLGLRDASRLAGDPAARLLVFQTAAWSPRARHWAGILVHAADAAVLAELIRRLLSCARPNAQRRRAAAAAALGALLWAVHPVSTQAAAWAGALPDLVSALFALLATLAYLAARRRPGRPWAWTAAALLYAAACLTSWRAVSLPAVWLALDVWPLKRLSWPLGAQGRAALLEKLPYAALGAALAGAAARARGVRAALTPLAAPAQAAARALFYLRQLAWPMRALPSYSWSAVDPFGWLTPASPVLVVAATAALGWGARRRPGALAAWLAYLAALFPAVCLERPGVAVPGSLAAYLALMPAAAAAGFLLLASRRAWPFFAALALAASLAGATRAQLSGWGDPETLWRGALESDPASPQARARLAWALLDDGRSMEALALYDEQLRLFPGDALAAAQAARLRPRAADLEGDRSAGELLRAAGLADAGRLEEAAAAARRAVRLAPDSALAYRDLGWLLYRMDSLGQAQAALERAVALAPRDADSRRALGAVLLRQGRLEEAIAQFRKAVGLAPRDVEARRELRDALSLRRRLPRAPAGASPVLRRRN